MGRETHAREARSGCGLGDREVGGTYAAGLCGFRRRMRVPKRPPALAR